MTNDLSIKVTVTCKDGDWTARSPVYSFYGFGASPEDALDDFADEVRRFYSGAKFSPRDNRPLDVSYIIKQVQADILVGIIEETPLDAFGVDCGGDNVSPETQELLEGECAQNALLLEAPEAPEDAADECIPRAPEHYALSFDRYFIEKLIVNCYDAILVPFAGGQHIKADDIVWLYERKVMKGAQVYRAVFVVEDVQTVSRAELLSTEWMDRHGGLQEIPEGDSLVITLNYNAMRGFPSGIPVPEGEIAPRGCNWLRSEYVRKLEEVIHAREE